MISFEIMGVCFLHSRLLSFLLCCFFVCLFFWVGRGGGVKASNFVYYRSIRLQFVLSRNYFI